MKNFKKIIKKILKWAAIITGMYFVGTTLYFGYSDVDEKKGVHNFYWSGINALWREDKEFGFKQNQSYETQLNGADGPYIFGDTIFTVDAKNQFISKPFDKSQPIEVKVCNEDNDSFILNIKKEHHQELDHFSMPTRLIAISDIESNFNAFFSFLSANGVMDKQCNWTFGNGHLVLNGDFVDRGPNATQVLWLIYKLEQQAEHAGGKVHFILGNHEIMNLSGDPSHADQKYMEVAKRISGQQHWDKATRHLFSAKSEMGKWLRTKNVIEKIGNYVFVHAGLNTKLVAENLTIKEINDIARKYYGTSPDIKEGQTKETLVLSSYHSPYWDRSLSMDMMYRTVFLANDPFGAPVHRTSQTELEQILKYYGGTKMIIGHSVVSDITTDYEGKVIKIDLKHGREKNSGSTKGLLVENGIQYKIDDLGKMQKL